MQQATHSVSLIVVAWRRGAARLVDFALGYTLWIVPTVFIAYKAFTPVTEKTDSLYLMVILGLLLIGIPVAFVLEAVWYRFLGATPGKRLFALRVVNTKGKVLTSTEYNARLLRLYCSGLIFGIPLLSQLGKLVQGACLVNRGTTTYDDGRYQVMIDTPTVYQIVAWVCLGTGIPFGIQILNISAAMAGY